MLRGLPERHPLLNVPGALTIKDGVGEVLNQPKFYPGTLLKIHCLPNNDGFPVEVDPKYQNQFLAVLVRNEQTGREMDFISENPSLVWECVPNYGIYQNPSTLQYEARITIKPSIVLLWQPYKHTEQTQSKDLI